MSERGISVFFSYSHKDQDLRDQLEVHLAMLKQQQVISVWHDRKLLPGDNLDAGVGEELEKAEIILLLVSPDFLASPYCYGKEMRRAMERSELGEARAIPIILRPCEWDQAPFGKLLATPTDGKAVTKWTDRDEAFLDITKAIRRAAEATHPAPGKAQKATQHPLPARGSVFRPEGPRSSNLRMTKTFSDHDRDVFLDESFEYMARFFENSLHELASRNPGYDGTFKRTDSVRFTATVYRNGKLLSRCEIRMGGSFGKAITYSQGVDLGGNSFNEILSVEAGEQSLYLKPLGMASVGAGRDRTNLSQDGGAEYYWEIFVKPLQQR